MRNDGKPNTFVELPTLDLRHYKHLPYLINNTTLDLSATKINKPQTSKSLECHVRLKVISVTGKASVFVEIWARSEVCIEAPRGHITVCACATAVSLRGIWGQE